MTRNKKVVRCAVALALVCAGAVAIAQDRNRARDAELSPAAKKFDFWLGDWHVESPSGHGVNYVRRILNGHVIQGVYEMPQAEFAGTSLTVFVEDEGAFSQTWVDNRGTHHLYTYRWEGDQMVGHDQHFDPDAQEQRRIRWFDITADSFTWLLEQSTDGGATWEAAWRVEMTRRG